MNKFTRFTKSVFAFVLSAVTYICAAVTAFASESDGSIIKVDIDHSAVLGVFALIIALLLIVLCVFVVVLKLGSSIRNRNYRLSNINTDDTVQLYDDLNNAKWKDEPINEADIPRGVVLEDSYKKPKSKSGRTADRDYDYRNTEPGLTPMRELDGFAQSGYDPYNYASGANVAAAEIPDVQQGAYRDQPYRGYAYPNTQIPTAPPTYPQYAQMPPQPRVYRPDASNLEIRMREEPSVDIRYSAAEPLRATDVNVAEQDSGAAFDISSIPSMTVRTMNIYPGGGRAYTGGYTEPVEDVSESKTYTFEFNLPEDKADEVVEAEPISVAPIIDAVKEERVELPEKEELSAIVTIEKKTVTDGAAAVSKAEEADDTVLVRLGDDLVDNKLMRTLDDVLDELGGNEVTEIEAVDSPTEEAELVFRGEETPGVDTASVDEIFDDEEGEARLLIGGKYVRVRYQTSFMSRFIQAEERLQDYYSVIKNVLMSYNGITSDIGWRCENFAKDDRVCAKLNVKDGMLLLYLTLDPGRYRDSKYHYTYIYDKYAKYKNSKVSMLVKIKSDRALKYALELIIDMMEELSVSRGEVKDIDYRHPYETTERLIERGLIKIISSENSDDTEKSQPETVSETVETKALFDSIEVDEEPVLENAEPSSLDEQSDEGVAQEEHHIIHADAKEVDQLLSDEEAIASIELVEDERAFRFGKLCEVNLDSICAVFNDGDVVTLEELKARGLVSRTAGRVKILARGVMTKTLTIYADRFSLQAVKMITLAGGHAEQYK